MASETETRRATGPDQGVAKTATPDVLAVKWGYNPNSSSLGVDVTFLLFGLSAITLVTPVVGWWLRARAATATAAASATTTTTAEPDSGAHA